MQMNLWDISGVLVNIEELAYQWAKKSNMAKRRDFIPLVAMYDDYIFALKQSVKAFKGCDLMLEYDNNGYYRKLYITYHNEMIGMAYDIEVK